MAPLDGLAAVHLFASLPGGQQVANSFHISDPGSGAPPSPADLSDLATQLDAALATTYRDILTTTSTYTAIKVAQVPDPTIPRDAYADFILPKNLAGLRSEVNEASPNQACAVTSLKTNSGQRSYRGHLMLPPALAARSMNGQTFNHSSAYYTACVAFSAALQTGCFGSHTWSGSKLSSFYLCIYSKTLQSRALPSVTEVISVVQGDAVHWLRSRARGTV